MPTYSYACTECGNRFDVVQAFTDDALITCDRCSGRLRKLFSPVGVVFKGSGFYHNDSREAHKASTNGSNGSGKTSASAGSENGSQAGSGDKSGSTEKPTTSSDKAASSDKAGSSSSSTTAAAASG